MIGRRRVVGAALALPALAFASPAIGCRAAAPKDRRAYTRTIDRLFEAWWRRDLLAFRSFFDAGEGEESFDAAAIFASHFVRPDPGRFRGEILFSGSTAIAQVVTPRAPDPARGICGGMAYGELFAVDFYPGLRQPTVRSLAHVGASTLAESEWSGPASRAGNR